MRMVRVLLLVLCGVASSIPVRAASLDEEIGLLVEAAHRDGTFNGNALVTRNGQVLLERSFGLADREAGRPHAASTRFLAFSIVKPMTAVLVYQEIARGKLRLPDTLAAIFPSLSGKPAGAITMAQLLGHSSGIEEVISKHRGRRITPRDLESAAVKPGVAFEYSNTGYVVLVLVLEAVNARPYEALMRERIFEPAGMTDSGLARTGLAIPMMSRGYRTVAGVAKPVELDIAMEALDGAGSLYTTARDLWRFDRALSTGELLDRKHQDAMVAPANKATYGHGWFLGEQGGRLFPWHAGSYRGHTGVFIRQTARNEVIVLLSNREEDDVLGLRTKILRRLKN